MNKSASPGISIQKEARQFFSMTMFRHPLTAILPLVDAFKRTPQISPAEEEVIALFDQLRAPVLRYLLSSRVPLQDAEEIVQEVFLLLFQNLRRGKTSPNPAGWVFRTAHNLLLRHRDRLRRHAEHFDASYPAPESIADLSPAADVVLEDSQRQNSLLAVVRALPEQDQSCLYLRTEGLRYREIAEVLGISLGGVAKSLQRSIARLGRGVTNESSKG